MKELSLIAIDLAKNVFQVCGMTQHHQVIFNHALRRQQLAAFMANQPPVDVAMEACYSSHYWGRLFETMGHRVRLLPTQHVAPFVQGKKVTIRVRSLIYDSGKLFLTHDCHYRPVASSALSSDIWAICFFDILCFLFHEYTA